MSTRPNTTIELLDARAMARLLGIGEKALYARLRRAPENLPPSVRAGRRIYWRASTVDSWFAEREGETRLATAAGQ